MTQKIYQLLIVLLLLLSAFGWGRLTSRFLDRRIFVFHSLTTIVGLAVIGFIGGLLNLVHLAKLPGVLLLLAIGLSQTVNYLFRQRPWLRRTFPLESIPLFVAPFPALCAGLLLMPTTVFNFHDDFHLYVTRATRMSQTGSLAGTAFDCLGVDSLGSASFFHSFFLGVGGIESLVGFDAVAGFALCLLLLAELSLRWRLPWWLGLSAILGLTWINPQYVNISPLYSGAAGVAALIVCGILLARTLVRDSSIVAWRLALTIGLLTAWLATMKMPLAFFAGIFLATLFAILGAVLTNRIAVLKTATIAVAAGFAGMLPWIFVAMPALLEARKAASDLLPNATLAEKYPSLVAHQSPLLFAPLRLFYGDTPVLYLAISGIALALGLAGLVHWLRHRRTWRLSGMPAITAAGVAMIAVLFLNSHLFPISMAIRYSCPVLIGGIFVAGLGFLHARTSASEPARRWIARALTAGTVSLIILFNGSFLERIDKAMRDHTLLAFPYNVTYASYCQDMLAEEQSTYHRQIQSRMPTGATAFVWTATPFHFDFERNHLVTVYLGGLSSPPLHFPAGLPPEKLEQYLRNNGVQFVLLELRGYGVTELSFLARMQRSRLPIDKKFGEFGAYLRTSLDQLAKRGEVLFSDERMLLFELRRPDRAGAIAVHDTPAL